MKNVFAILVSSVSVAAAAMPEITSVSLSQLADKSVKVDYSLSSAPAIVTAKFFTNGVAVADENISAISGDIGPGVSKTACSFLWKPRRDLAGTEASKLNLTVELKAYSEQDPPDYMVVPLVQDAYSKIRFYEIAADIPGGVGSYANKSTNIVMRRISARGIPQMLGSPVVGIYNDNADWTRSLSREVVLSNDYWIAIYETTHGQWRRACNGQCYSETYFTVDSEIRPCERAYYYNLRISNTSTYDPQGCDKPQDVPGAESFLAIARDYTGLSFDLPTESEWEIAGRAGVPANRWNTGILITNATKDVNCPGRYRYNGGYVGENYNVDPAADCSVDYGPAVVGSYAPNAFGIYDMHGNMMEWCRDFYAAGVANLVGALNTNGNWHTSGHGIHSLRGGYYRSNGVSDLYIGKKTGEHAANSYYGMGFRMVLPLDLKSSLTGN